MCRQACWNKQEAKAAIRNCLTFFGNMLMCFLTEFKGGKKDWYDPCICMENVIQYSDGLT